MKIRIVYILVQKKCLSTDLSVCEEKSLSFISNCLHAIPFFWWEAYSLSCLYFFSEHKGSNLLLYLLLLFPNPLNPTAKILFRVERLFVSIWICYALLIFAFSSFLSSGGSGLCRWSFFLSHGLVILLCIQYYVNRILKFPFELEIRDTFRRVLLKHSARPFELLWSGGAFITSTPNWLFNKDVTVSDFNDDSSSCL